MISALLFLLTIWHHHHDHVFPFGRMAASSSSFPALHHDDDGVVAFPNLAIFPLRKFPRLPSDRLTLNLYEDRYLKMAESIIESPSPSTPLFGALYVADKPQLVTEGGTGSIVPLVEPGDVGTLFAVLDWNEATIPTVGNMERRRRIQLNATGVARFQIQHVVSEGSAKDKPYIVVNATLLLDQKQNQAWSPQELAVVQATLTSQPSQALDYQEILSSVVSLNLDWMTKSDNSNYYNEHLSFFVTSKLLNAQEFPRDLVPLLKLQSTRERLRSLINLQQKKKK